MAAESKAEGPCVLVVEDDAIIALAISMDLEGWGYKLCGIADCRKRALTLAENGRPALALMDINLAGGDDGVEVAKELRERFGTAFIYLTGQHDERTRQRAAATKPLDCLFKPYSPEQLRSALERALN